MLTPSCTNDNFNKESELLKEGDIGVCGIAVLVNFSCGISVILILNCVIAVFSESAGWGISGVLVNDIWLKRNCFTRFPTLWRSYATPAIRKLFENLCLQSLALTIMVMVMVMHLYSAFSMWIYSNALYNTLWGTLPDCFMAQFTIFLM